MLILDTDAAVDLVRGYDPALQWFQSQSQSPAIAGIAYMEVLTGCLNKSESIRVRALFAPLAVFWPTDDDRLRALNEFSALHLSHRLGLLDALIAATAVGRNATLVTFNTKHFAVVPGLTTEQPYTRS